MKNTTKQPIKQKSTGPIDNNVKIMVNDVKIMLIMKVFQASSSLYHRA